MRRIFMLLIAGLFLSVTNASAQYVVNFEGAGETKTSYASGTITLSGLQWNMTEALIGAEANDWKIGLRSTRMRGYGTSSITMLENKANGIGTISFQYRRYGTDTQVDWKVEFSDDNGSTWTQIGSNFTAPASNDIQSFSAVVEVAGDIRVRIKRATEIGTANRRLNIDDITITDYTGGANVTATPVFSHLTGEYFSPFDLEITCATEGAAIYYTLNGDDPDNTSIEYILPITIDAPTSVRAIAYAPDFDPSAIAQADYTFPEVTEVANLAELRDAYLTKVDCFKVLGEVIVTFKQPFRNQLFIQDATAAILIDDLPGIIKTNYSVGDGITGMIGSFTYFGNMLQFNPAADPGPPSSAGNAIVPEVITVYDFLNNFPEYEAELVTIQNVSFDAIGSFFINGTVNNFSDASKASAMFRSTFYDVDYITKLLPQQPCDLTGICNARAEGIYFTSRSLNDFSCELPEVIIKITEIMFNPPESGNDTLEFVEFYNHGTSVVNMQNFAITSGVTFTFPNHIFNPSDYLLVSINSQALTNTFGSDSYQWISGNLSNSGELVRLSDPFGNVVTAVDFKDSGNWPVEPDGEGPSLEFCDPNLDNNDPTGWSVSTHLAAINTNGEGLYCTPGSGCSETPALPMLYPSGWNGVSSNLIPGRVSMEDLFAPANYNLVVILSKAGIYWPGQNINSIGEWDTYTGYKAKFDGSTFFVFAGTPLENRILQLEPGTQLVPVFSEAPVNVADVIQPLGNAIEFMFDISGGLIYWPTGGILPGTSNQSLNVLNPGIAYLAKVNISTAINFGELPKVTASNQPVKLLNTTPWNDLTATGGQHIISITNTALQNLQPGDFVGIFNSRELCAGMAQFNGNESVLPVVVYENDITTEAVDGMMAGEMMSVRIFRNGQTLDAIAIYSNQTENSDGLFTESGLSMISDLKVGSTGMGETSSRFSIYPNPSNGIFNIRVDVRYELVVTNVQGQQVFSSLIESNTNLDLSDQPAGIYFVRLTNNTQTLIERIVIE